MISRHLVFSLLVTQAAHAQHSPPLIETPTTAPVKLEPPPPPPPPQAMRSNGSSGWVDTKKPNYISPADIASMFRPKS